MSLKTLGKNRGDTDQQILPIKLHSLKHELFCGCSVCRGVKSALILYVMHKQMHFSKLLSIPVLTFQIKVICYEPQLRISLGLAKV